MQAAGLMPVEGLAAAAELQLRRVLAKEVEKEAKLAAAPSTSKEFVRSWRKLGWMTRDAFDENRDRYWQGVWHHQSVEEIFIDHGWPAAAEYHKRVMGLWSRGYLDGTSEVNSHKFRRGNVALAMHRDTYHDIMHSRGASRGEGGSAQRHLPKGGTKGKVSNDDTYCSEHGCYFPKAADHSWSWKTRVGTCAAAKAKCDK